MAAVSVAAHARSTLASTRGPSSTPSIFNPASTPAADIHHLSLFVIAICVAIFLVVFSLIVYATIKFRKKPGDDLEPPQIYGSNQVELAWTVIPILIVVVLFLAAARVIHAVEDAPFPPNTIEVTATGHQFWWEFQYPASAQVRCAAPNSATSPCVTTANELHVPVGVPTHIVLLSADTDHSFWVPQLAGKIDLIPNHPNEMWIEPHDVGHYVGQCAQYCGTQHAKMLLNVFVETPEDFQKWVQQQEAPAVMSDQVAAGRKVFEDNACMNCHTIGTNPSDMISRGRFGPDLTHLMSRTTIAAGAAPNDQQNLTLWIKDPDSIKPGCLMPAMQLDEKDVNALVAYLMSLQ